MQNKYHNPQEGREQPCDPDAVLGAVAKWQPWMETINAKVYHNVGIPPFKEVDHGPGTNDRRLKNMTPWFAFIFYIFKRGRRSCPVGVSKPLNGETPTL